MKKTLLILFRVLLLIGSIAVLITAFSRSVHVVNVRDRYIKDVVVVVNTNHIGSSYNNYYKYIYNDTEYDKMIPDQTHKDIGTTEIIWVNPSNPNDFIFDSELERQDNGSFLLKIALFGVILFIFSFILIKPDKKTAKAVSDSELSKNPVILDETEDVPEEIKVLWKDKESDSKPKT